MKLIRILAGTLLIITGMLHMIPVFATPRYPNAIPMLVFGGVYLAIGINMLLKRKIATILGIVFPLIGLGTGIFSIGFENWDVMLKIFFGVDAVVIIFCAMLLIDRIWTEFHFAKH